MTSFPTLQQSTTISPSLVDCFEFTPADVYDYLSNIDGSKACGPDLLPGFLLKHCASSLASPLAYLTFPCALAPCLGIGLQQM